MNKQTILSKVYSASSAVIVLVMLASCILFKWSPLMTTLTVLASLVISSPALFSLQILLWLSQRIQLQKGFAWILLLAFIPPLALITGWLMADFVPGETWLLLLLGIFSGYVGILTHGISVTQFFNSGEHEREGY
jgi:hypothetical protein